MKNRQKLFEIDRLMAKSLTKQICDGFRAAIVDGRLAGGDRFPTCREICGEFGVSMIVSGAVVRQLGREGLISSRPHVGSFVVPQESTAWRGSVLFVNAGGSFSAYAYALADALRENLATAGFLFTSINMPSRFIAGADISRLSAAIAARPKLVVLLHARTEVLPAVVKSGVDYVVIDDGGRKFGRKMPGSCRGRISTGYGDALSDFAAHCRSAGVRRVLEIGFERGYASAVPVFRRRGIDVSVLAVKETPQFRHYGNVQQAGLAAAEKLLAEGGKTLPDLVYFTDDYLAAGALISFARNGIHFPDDVRFVSLATKGFEPVWWQKVTRLEWDWFAQGETLARQIVDLLDSRTKSINSSISPQYVVGETFPEAST
jgi:DNA-binding transcriptional regulator YhcF (GntR family)